MKPRLKTVLMLFVAALLLVGAVSLVAASDLEQQSTFASPVLVVNNSFLNVRSGPGIEYNVLATVTGGTVLPVLSVAPDGVWYQVNTSFGPGWVNVTYTIARGTFTNVPVSTASVVTTGAVVGDAAALGQGGAVAAAVPASSGHLIGVSTIEGGDFRAEPSSTSALIRFLAPSPNNVYPLLDSTVAEGRPWYKTSIPGVGVGWSDRFILRPMVCFPGESVTVLTQGSNVLLEGVANNNGYAAPAGTEAYVLGFESGMARLEFPDGGIGLVSIDVTASRSDSVLSYCDGANAYSVADIAAGAAPVAASSAASLGQGGAVPVVTGTTIGTTPVSYQGPRVVVNTGFLNVRSGPGAEYAVVATVPGGTELPVAARMSDGIWYLVDGGFGRGWLNSQYIIFRGNYEQIPIIEYDSIDIAAVTLGQGGAVAPVVAGNTAVLGQGGAVAAAVPASSGHLIGVSTIEGGDFRAEPSSTSALVRFLAPSPNDIYPLLDAVVAEGRPWYKTSIPGVGVGWSDRFILRPMICFSGESVAVLTQGANIALEGVANSNGSAAPAGTEAYVLGFESGMVRLEFPDGGIGLVALDATASRSDSVLSYCDGANAYSVADIAAGAAPVAASSAASLGQGGAIATEPQIAATGILPQGYQGPRVIVNTGFLNIRSGPSASFGVIATVQGGVEMAVIGRASDGVWYLVEGTFGQGWLNNQYVLFRGNYAQVPVLDFNP